MTPSTRWHDKKGMDDRGFIGIVILALIVLGVVFLVVVLHFDIVGWTEGVVGKFIHINHILLSI